MIYFTSCFKLSYVAPVTENVPMNEPASSGRNNFHHDDQGWNGHKEEQSEEGLYLTYCIHDSILMKCVSNYGP